MLRMIRTWQVGAGLVAGAALIASCSPSDASEPTATSSATATATADDGDAVGASVQQWASRVAPLAADYADAEEPWDEEVCTPSVLEADPLCNAQALTMSLTAQAAAITLEGLQDPASPQFLGAPPAEIAELVTETTTAARAATTAGDAVTCPGEQCVSTAFAFVMAWDALGDAYTAWGPYS